MSLSKIVSLCVFSILFQSALALPEPVARSIINAEEVGATRFRVLFWDIYDISLYAEEGDFNPDRPFAIRLRYLRDLKGEAIAERSAEEMRHQGVNEVKLAEYFAQMRTIFPDVERDTELIGVFFPESSTRFFKGTIEIGEVLDPAFGTLFSRIWLGDQTRQPAMRSKLLGES